MKKLHIDKSIETVTKYIAKTGVAPSRLALEAGLSINTLRDCNNPDWAATSTTLKALETYIEGKK